MGNDTSVPTRKRQRETTSDNTSTHEPTYSMTKRRKLVTKRPDDIPPFIWEISKDENSDAYFMLLNHFVEEIINEKNLEKKVEKKVEKNEENTSK